MVRIGNYILVTDKSYEKYLQIGEIVDIEYYNYDNGIKAYKVEFADGIVEYDWHFEDCFRVLMLERI